MTTSNTRTLYATIRLTFRIDDPERLADAAQLFPYEVPLDRASQELTTPDMLRDPGTALQAAAAQPIMQAFTGIRSIAVPGAALVDVGHINLSYQPPQKPTPPSA
jgi:hypothetical protein